MTKDQFIEEWLQLDVSQTCISLSEETIPNITVFQCEPKIKSFGRWSYSKSCLYKDGLPFVYRLNGALIINETYRKDYRSNLGKAFKHANAVGYLFRDFEFSHILDMTLRRFKNFPTYGYIDKLIIEFLVRLNVSFKDLALQAIFLRFKEKYNL